MPHYRLNLYNATGQSEDAEGADYRDLAAARAAAIDGIRSILSAEALDGEINLHGHLEIVDDAGTVLDTIDFADVLKVLRP